tara:strand:- start:2721 stop:2900 length:180 start_codon:yes stop_codon:yes gene_type:complete
MNFSATTGDVLRSQFEFAEYRDEVGWVGPLTILEPGKGYQMKTSLGGNLTFSRVPGVVY